MRPNLEGVKRLNRMRQMSQDIKNTYLNVEDKIDPLLSSIQNISELNSDDIIRQGVLHNVNILIKLSGHMRTIALVNQIRQDYLELNKILSFLETFCAENANHQLNNDDLAASLQKYKDILSEYFTLLKEEPYPKIKNILNKNKLQIVLMLERNIFIKCLYYLFMVLPLKLG